MSAIALAADPADDRPQQCGKIATVLVITDMFTRNWKQCQFLVPLPLRTISSGTPGGIQYAIFDSILPWPDSPIQKLSTTNSIIAGLITRCSPSAAAAMKKRARVIASRGRSKQPNDNRTAECQRTIGIGARFSSA